MYLSELTNIFFQKIKISSSKSGLTFLSLCFLLQYWWWKYNIYTCIWILVWIYLYKVKNVFVSSFHLLSVSSVHSKRFEAQVHISCSGVALKQGHNSMLSCCNWHRAKCLWDHPYPPSTGSWQYPAVSGITWQYLAVPGSTWQYLAVPDSIWLVPGSTLQYLTASG